MCQDRKAQEADELDKSATVRDLRAHGGRRPGVVQVNRRDEPIATA